MSLVKKRSSFPPSYPIIIIDVDLFDPFLFIYLIMLFIYRILILLSNPQYLLKFRGSQIVLLDPKRVRSYPELENTI